MCARETRRRRGGGGYSQKHTRAKPLFSQKGPPSAAPSSQASATEDSSRPPFPPPVAALRQLATSSRAATSSPRRMRLDHQRDRPPSSPEGSTSSLQVGVTQQNGGVGQRERICGTGKTTPSISRCKTRFMYDVRTFISRSDQVSVPTRHIQE